jgi:X-X-X-Leu-X-X-Gly heptad repeat protein
MGTFNVDFSDLDSPGVVSDVSYTGLDDTAESFSGSSTLSAPLAGSPLQLSTGLSGLNDGAPTLVAGQNEQELVSGMYPAFASQVNSASLEQGASFSPSLASTTSPSSALAISGVSDPPWGSLEESTPYSSVTSTAANGLSSLAQSFSKFGAGVAQMFVGASAPSTVAVSGSNVPSAAGSPVSGSTTVILVVAAAALILLLARGK